VATVQIVTFCVVTLHSCRQMPPSRLKCDTSHLTPEYAGTTAVKVSVFNFCLYLCRSLISINTIITIAENNGYRREVEL
jgi:hypothetical protein